MRITFLGAAETVTGSRFLVDSDDRRLLVDSGLFQGVKRVRRRNWEPFPVAPGTIDAVVLTHAHVDHSGYLPALVRDGFRGRVWTTPATADLCRLLLPDAAYLQEEDARHANRHGTSRHRPALPLYTGADAEEALTRLHPHPVDQAFTPTEGLQVRFSPAGHILGAACVRVTDGATSVLFTGDVGTPDDPVMRPPAPPPDAHVVVTESTYGDRAHTSVDPAARLAEIVTRTVARGGTVLIPAFAVGRSQLVLHLLAELRHGGDIPDVPIHLNSPMAIDATWLYRRHADQHRLDREQVARIFSGVQFVRSVEDSKRLTRQRGPRIVLSASGMATGGRVLHHLLRIAPDPASTICLVGYQAPGTRGAALLAGTERIKVFGAHVPVRAEVAVVGGLSAHADAAQLTEWLAGMPGDRRRVAHVVHGEPAAADALRVRLRDDLGWVTHVPEHGESVTVAQPVGAR